MDKDNLFPIGIGVGIFIFMIFVVYSVQSQTDYWNKRFEENKQNGLALDEKNFNEIKSSASCDSMFISIMKHDNEWWEESTRQKAWDLYNERCL